MDRHLIEEEIAKELKLLPLAKLRELYQLIRRVRASPKVTDKNVGRILEFAGCWQEMDEADFQEFAETARHRR